MASQNALAQQFNAMGGFGAPGTPFQQINTGQGQMQQLPFQRQQQQQPGLMEMLMSGPPQSQMGGPQPLPMQRPDGAMPQFDQPNPLAQALGRLSTEASYHPTPGMLRADPHPADVFEGGGRNFQRGGNMSPEDFAAFKRDFTDASTPRRAPPLPIPPGAQMNAEAMAMTQAGRTFAPSMDLVGTRYDVGREKMADMANTERESITERLLANADGTHFGGAVPVTMDSGRVQFVKPGKLGAAGGVSREEALRRLIERSGGTYDAEGYRPSPGRSIPRMSEAQLTAMRDANERIKARRSETSQRVAENRAAKSQLLARLAQQQQMAGLLRNPQTSQLAAALMGQNVEQQGLNQRAQMENQRLMMQFAQQSALAREQMGQDRSMSEADRGLRGTIAQNELAQGGQQHLERMKQMDLERARYEAEAAGRMSDREALYRQKLTEGMPDQEARRVSGYGTDQQPLPGLPAPGATADSQSTVPYEMRQDLAGKTATDQRQLLVQKYGITDPQAREMILREMNPDVISLHDYDPEGIGFWDFVMGHGPLAPFYYGAQLFNGVPVESPMKRIGRSPL